MALMLAVSGPIFPVEPLDALFVEADMLVDESEESAYSEEFPKSDEIPLKLME